MTDFRLALAQINPTMGALSANAERIRLAAEQALAGGASVIVFPELSLCGYPPEDLVLKPHFVRDCERTLEQLAEELPRDLVCLIGLPVSGKNKPRNAVAVVEGGRVATCYHKHLLPNYGVFDEQRVFEAGERSLCLQIDGIRLGIHICEDSWYPEKASLQAMKDLNLSALLNLSASPFHKGKLSDREAILKRTASTLGAPLVYCNLVGG